MKTKKKRLCNRIIALSLAASVVFSAAAIQTALSGFKTQPSISMAVYAGSYGDVTQIPGYVAADPDDPDSLPRIVVNWKTSTGESGSYCFASGEELQYYLDGYTVGVGNLYLPYVQPEEGKTHIGWSLSEGGARIDSFTDDNLDGNATVTLYPVFRDEVSAEEAQEIKNQAIADLAEIAEEADQIKAEAANPEASREDLLSQLEALQNRISSIWNDDLAGVPLEEADSSALSDATNAAWKAIDNAREEVYKLHSAKDKAAVETILEKLAQAKAKADAAKAAADADNADAFLENYNAAQDLLKEAYDVPWENWDYINEATEDAYDSVYTAMDAAWDSYSTNATIGYDEDGNRYTFDGITADVVALGDDSPVTQAAKTKYSANNFVKAFTITLKAKENGKAVTLDAADAAIYAQAELGPITKPIWTSTVQTFHVDGDTYTAVEGFLNDSSEDGKYYDYIGANASGSYVVTGNYHSEDAVVVGAIDYDDPTEHEYTQKQIEEQDLLNYYPLSEVDWDGGAQYNQYASALPASAKAKLLDIYDIYLRGWSLSVIPGKTVTVNLQNLAWAGKTIDVYHYVWVDGSDDQVPKKIASGIKVDEKGIFTFVTDGFSPFAFAESSPEPASDDTSSAAESTSASTGSSSETSTTQGTSTTSPTTGERSTLPFVLLAIGSLCIAGGTFFWKKRETATQE